MWVIRVLNVGYVNLRNPLLGRLHFACLQIFGSGCQSTHLSPFAGLFSRIFCDVCDFPTLRFNYKDLSLIAVVAQTLHMYDVARSGNTMSISINVLLLK